MLSFIGNLAASFAINISSSLVMDGYIDKKDKDKIKRIRERIIDFNRSFENTELDTYTFEIFLNNQGVDDDVFSFVFTNFEKDSVKIDEFKNCITKKAIEYVNESYSSKSRNPIKREELFFEYFDRLIDEVLKIRHEILNLHEKAVVSILTYQVQTVGIRVIEELKEEIRRIKSDNVFAEDLIESVVDLVNQWRYNDALKIINETLEDSEQLSINQKEVLLYQRARVFINRKDFSALKEVKDKIGRINAESKYIYEINFYISRETRDGKLLDETIDKFREARYSDEKIVLKRVEYSINDNESTNLITECFLDEVKLKAEYNEYPEAHFYLGISQLRKSEYLKAKNSFYNAYELKMNVIYYYNALIAGFYIHMTNASSKYNRSDEFIAQIKELAEKFASIEYISNEFEFNDKVDYWTIIVTLWTIIDAMKALEIAENLPDDLKSHPAILSKIARIHYVSGDEQKALIILEGMTESTLEDIIMMFMIYTSLKKWTSIIDISDKFKGHDYMKHNYIVMLHLLAKYRMTSLEETEQDIKNLLSKDSFEAIEVDVLIEILSEHKDSEVWTDLVSVINNHYIVFHILEKERLAEKLLSVNENKLVQQLLLPVINESEKLFVLFLKTFESLEKLNGETHTLYKIVEALYKSGIRYQSLLRSKCSIERLFDNKRKALQSLCNYKELFGMDYYYAYYYTGTMFEANNLSNIEEEVKFLVDSNKPEALLLVSHILAARGDWTNAQELALDAVYQGDSISMEILKSYISLYMSNIDKEDEEITIDEVKANTVVTIVNVNSNEVKKIAIHRKGRRVLQSKEDKFGCENCSSDDTISLILASNGYLSQNIELDDGTYRIQEIINLHVYMIRYCWSKLDSDYPNHGFYQKISADDINDFLEEMKKIMGAHNKNRMKKLDLYNFKENDLGMPISFLSGKEPTLFVQTFIGLLHMENQIVFSGQISLYNDKKYVHP